ncbi:MAG: UDP-N-acetylmuramate:L-alanyl-gamma-D-glutamyl-meso-diaminopimelate ligase [bacterium]
MNTSPEHIHFSGICGTAMASLAVLLHRRGLRITGSDENVYPPMSDLLASEGIPVASGYAAENLPERLDLLVIGNALSRGNPEVEAALERKLRYVSMAELLKEHFIRGNTSLVVAGTHGKTTTTSLLAWTFLHAGRDPGFLIGGIAENLKTSCREGKGGFFITEGDEYDTAFFDKRSKFFHYLPDQLILNNLEFDHADIFASLEDILRSFRWMLRLVPRNGLIAANGDDPNLRLVLEHAYSPVVTFGFGQGCEVRASELTLELRREVSGTRFQVESSAGSSEFWIPLLGEHNVRNALGVLVLARHNGLDDDEIQAALSAFQGIKRRLELRGISGGVWVYDDFAHHPTAIRETLAALRLKHPEARVFAVFEPRSNTSVINVHQRELGQAFRNANFALFSTPHRQEKVPVDQRLNLQEVCEGLRRQGTEAWALAGPEEIVGRLKEQVGSGDVVIVMSNGGFGGIHEKLLTALESAR